MSLNEIQFKHQMAGSTPEKHVVSAYKGKNLVGSMHWHAEQTVPDPITRVPLKGTITEINVSERGQGIATGMWKYGQQFDPPPAHSPSRTPEGDAWAKKVGGYRPATYDMLYKSQAQRDAANKLEPMTGSW